MLLITPEQLSPGGAGPCPSAPMDASFSPHKSFLPRSAFQEHPLQALGEICSSSGVSKKILIEGGGSSQGAWLFIAHEALRGASSEQGL